MVTVWLALALAVMLALGGGVWAVHENGVEEGRAACKAEIDAADKKLKAAADKAEQEAANHITDMEAAYEVGESNAKTVYRTIVEKGVHDVQTNPVFNDRACGLPPDSLQLVNRARAGVRAAPDTGSSDAPVRGTGTVDGGPVKGPVPANAAGRRPLGKVHTGP